LEILKYYLAGLEPCSRI